MLLIAEKGIRGGMCQSTHRYAKANNKYMKNDDKKNWAIISNIFRRKQFVWMDNVSKLPVNGFMWCNDHLSDFNKEFIKNYNEDSNEGHFLEIDIEYPKQLWNSHKEQPFLPERKKLEKVVKLICSIEDKEKYVIHIRALKTSIN